MRKAHPEGDGLFAVIAKGADAWNCVDMWKIMDYNNINPKKNKKKRENVTMEELEKTSEQEAEQLIPAEEAEASEMIAEQPEQPEQFEQPAEPKKVCACRKKGLMAAAIAAAAILVVVLLACLLGGKGNGNYGMFVKDSEIFMVDKPGGSVMEITRQFIAGTDASPSDYRDIVPELAALMITVRQNGNRVFFPDKLGSSTASGLTMYYRDLDEPDKDPVKIDTEITDFHVSEDGKRVIYLKGRDKKLYVHDLERKTRIAEGVTNLTVSEDCKTVGYLTDEQNFYLWKDGKDAQKLAIDVEIAYYDTDRSDFYFLKEGTLYKQQIGVEERTVLGENVDHAVAVYDSGEAYYVRASKVERNMADYVEDDMLAEDNKITEPVAPDYPDSPSYPYSWNYPTTADYQKAKEDYQAAYKEYEDTCAKLKADYEAAQALYFQKEERDNLRASLKASTKEYTEYALYHHDGTQETMLTEAMTDIAGMTYSAEKAVVQYNVYNATEITKVKLSELKTATEVTKLIEEAMYSSSDVYVAVGPNGVLVGENEAKNFVIAPDCASLYYLDDVNALGEADLYRMSIDTKSQVAGVPELYDSEVSKAFGLKFMKDDSRILYAKCVDALGNTGDLYIAGQMLDYDMYLRVLECRDDQMVYFTDWDALSRRGTLQIKKIGAEDKRIIGEDIFDFAFTNDGDILYLNEYSTKYFAGVLHSYDISSGKSARVTYDVMALIDIAE